MATAGEMAEASASNSVSRNESGPLTVKSFASGVKEEEVCVKREPAECVVCGVRGGEWVEAGAAQAGTGSRLSDVLRRHAPRAPPPPPAPAPLCRACRHLLDMLDQAELEFLKLKESFEAIISRNPLYENQLAVENVKTELGIDIALQSTNDNDSEDEPLALKRKRRPRKVTKKVNATQKKKSKAKDVIISFKELQASTKSMDVEVKDVKKEKAVDGCTTSRPSISESETNNGVQNELKTEAGEDFNDDDDDSDFLPDDFPEDKEDQPPKKGKRGPRKKDKPLYECDQCNNKYTSLKRFELHKEKHSGGKPPYICEVCGARYKHKRACDVHIALHRGISDWKCTECDKLFPSKGALQRHNNIHTGQLNYQCDLCGKSFIHTSSFKMHKLSHSGLKPHTCDVCGLALMTRSHLKRHKRVHTGEKRHECQLCGKRFSERYNLIAHAKSHEAVGEAVVPAAPRRRLFRCTFCQERFERRYMLERHMSAVHNRTLERLPATPRNTMSKLLKAQAQARTVPTSVSGSAPPSALTPDTPASDVSESKEECGPDGVRTAVLTHKLALTAGGALAVTSWSGAYAAEFNLRPDYH